MPFLPLNPEPELSFEEQFVREAFAQSDHYRTHADTLHQDDCPTCRDFAVSVRAKMELAIQESRIAIDQSRRRRAAYLQEMIKRWAADGEHYPLTDEDLDILGEYPTADSLKITLTVVK